MWGTERLLQKRQKKQERPKEKEMSKLHELLAVESSLRQQGEACRRDLMNTFEKKKAHFQEVIVTFTPKEENAPSVVESKMGLQSTIEKELDWVGEKLVKAMDCAHQIDEANMVARQDVVLDNGVIILKSVPATSLLQLEKRLKELQEFAMTIPTLDPTKGFEPDEARGAGIYKARDVNKKRTHKVQEFEVVVAPTKEHPAQVKERMRDIETGDILQQEWSSLLTVSQKGDIIDRIEDLVRAVKSARSRANEQEVAVSQNKIAQHLLDYAFKGKA